MRRERIHVQTFMRQIPDIVRAIRITRLTEISDEMFGFICLNMYGNSFF